MFRRCFVVAVLLLPLIFLCGKLLMTPLSRAIDEPDVARRYTILDAGGPPAAIRGWPWVFLKSVTYGWPPQSAQTDVFYFSCWYLLADVSILALFLFAAAALLVRHRRRRGAWLRFSLREMFALTAAIAIPLSWWTIHRIEHSREQQAVVFLSVGGCWVDDLPIAKCAPQWLQRMFPEDQLAIFQHAGNAVRTPIIDSRGDFDRLAAAISRLPYVTNIEFGGNSLPYGSSPWLGSHDEFPASADFDAANIRPLEHLTRIGLSGIPVADDLVHWLGPLPRVREFRAYDCPITDRSLEQIAHWEALERFEVYGPPLRGSREGGAKITDVGIKSLAQLPHMREVYLQSLDITDAAADAIARMPSLETVGLRYCLSVTDAALIPFAKLPRLRHLDLCGSKITDAGIETILKLKDLQILELYECANLTEASIRRLLELPNLTELNIPTASVSEETLKELKAHIKSVYVN
jgi:hypothetical protein